MDYSVLITGAAGQGMDTVGNLLEKTLKRHGYYVFSYKDFMSRVRGGHNFVQIRFSDKPIHSYDSKVDVIFGLNKESIKLEKSKLKDQGTIVCDEDVSQNKELICLPLIETSRKIGNRRVQTTVGMGAILKYFGLDIRIAEDVIEDELKESIVDINIEALKAGYNLVDEKYKLDVLEDKHIIINGNQAVALGAIAAGCKFYCGYPMTPASSILTYIASKANEMNIVVDQVEDEIAALNMALGASYAGARSMTASSGGGFALMVEALSLAGIIETPVVVLNAQRPAPATGIATRTEQADLRFLIHAGHGEFPRMVIALRNPEDAFYQTTRAFNLADKYQIPVLLMTDQHLADYKITTEPFDFSKIYIERYIVGPEIVKEKEYKRYKFTETGISPRLIPGKVPGQIVLVDSHEHDEWGNITEDGEMRVNMMDKRMKKLEGLKTEVEEPWLIGKERPENLIVCWGSTYGAVKDAVDRLINEGVSIGGLIFGDIWPFPTKKLLKVSKYSKNIIDIEQNATGQLDSIIRQETPLESNYKIFKYDGRPFNGDEIYNKLIEIV